MERLIRYIVPAVLVGCLITSPVRGEDIIWASENPDPTMGDFEFVDLLEGAGHNVSRVMTNRDALTTEQIDLFNSSDLIIAGRGVHSGSWTEANEVTIWNTQITAPVIVMSPFLTRTNRAGWQTGTATDLSGPTPLIATDPGHPIFSGIAFEADGVTMANDYNFMVAGTNAIGDPLVPGGIVIATNPSVAEGNGVAIAEWPTGTTVIPDATDDQQLAGPRYFFAGGSLESGDFATTVGVLDLTAEGQMLFLNTVNYALDVEPPVPGDFNGDGDVTAADFMILSNNLGGHLDGPVGRSEGDMNFDQRVDLDDFGQFKELFPGAFAAAQGVPEPATISLIACVLATLACCRLRSRGR